MKRVESVLIPSSGGQNEDDIGIDIISFDNTSSTKTTEQTADTGASATDYSFNKYFKSGATTNANVRWNRKNEQVIVNYKNKATAYSVLYLNSSAQYSKYYKYINIPFIILSIASMLCQTIFATIIYSNPTYSYNGVLSIISTIVSAILTIVAYWKNKTNYRLKSMGCQEASKAFSDFADEINTILTVPSNQRANPYEVLNLINSDYKKLIKLHSNYQIPTNIYNDFDRINKQNGIVIDIFDNTKNHKFNFYAHPMSQRIITDKFISVIKQSETESNSKLIKELEKEYDVSKKQNTEDTDTVVNIPVKKISKKKVRIAPEPDFTIDMIPEEPSTETNTEPTKKYQKKNKK